MPMTLLEMLYQQYGTNEPILLSEITFEDYSRPWITPNMLDDDKKERIAEYIGANNISKKDILKYASVFPDKVMRNLIESEAIFCVI